jgi:hypothetical protein
LVCHSINGMKNGGTYNHDLACSQGENDTL